MIERQAQPGSRQEQGRVVAVGVSVTLGVAVGVWLGVGVLVSVAVGCGVEV